MRMVASPPAMKIVSSSTMQASLAMPAKFRGAALDSLNPTVLGRIACKIANTDGASCSPHGLVSSVKCLPRVVASVASSAPQGSTNLTSRQLVSKETAAVHMGTNNRHVGCKIIVRAPDLLYQAVVLVGPPH